MHADTDFMNYDDDGKIVDDEHEVEEIEEVYPSMHTSQMKCSREMT